MKLRYILVVFLGLTAWARADEPIIGTKHNLSVSGPGPVKAQSQSQICIFCHVPHHGLGPRGDNRPQSTAIYRPYNSPTMVSPPPGAPTGSTRLCLSCHDGTIAIGQTVASGTISLFNTGMGGTMPAGSNVGTDLRKSHPVSFQPGLAPELRSPPLGDAVKLDASGSLQCTSCHDPHRDGMDPVQKKFLVKSNRASGLCLTCHSKASWTANRPSHQASVKFYDATLGAHTPYTTVTDNGCESCHRPHAAATEGYLLKGVGAQVCLQCHDGRVAQKNLSFDLNKPFVHTAIGEDPNLHSAGEGPSNVLRSLPEAHATQARHVQCPDCHDVHSSNDQTARAPNVPGSLFGAWGMDRNNTKVSPARYEYEICFKCHAESANKPNYPQPPETVRRLVPDTNLRQVFDQAAPSAHPVEGPGRSANVPGLLMGLTPSSVIYCTDCHSSDSSSAVGGSGPRGPHGSNYRHLLERNLTTADNTIETPDAYALCYKCHDRSVLLSDQSGFKPHRSHVVDRHAPCTACHDWHGVSVMQGNEISNAHLINFDISIVSAAANGMLRYTSRGLKQGSCTLKCHTIPHLEESY